MKNTKIILKEYHPKIILAWAEAISGNKKLRDWLAKNDYIELYMSVFAIHLKDDARKWLMENGFPHILAMIQGVECNNNALIWLKNNNFDILYNIARASDDSPESLLWLKQKNLKEYVYLALKIKYIKDIIQSNHDDVHKISPE